MDDPACALLLNGMNLGIERLKRTVGCVETLLSARFFTLQVIKCLYVEIAQPVLVSEGEFPFGALVALSKSMTWQ